MNWRLVVVTDCQLLSLTDGELGHVDPLAINLAVASAIPSLSGLDIPHYQALVDGWAVEVAQRVREDEPIFRQNPSAWRNDVNFFNLSVLCQYVECELGVRYREDQRDAASVRYTEASDLFLNGVIDTRRGTCGNMAALHLAIGWRLGWPVSLAAARAHLFLRYDDGLVRHNVEATQSGYGGMNSPTDEDLIRKYRLPPEALSSGSDLRAVTPRELLGIFVGLRARHFRDCGDFARAEGDFLLARWLFPSSRELYSQAMGVSVLRGRRLFHPSEEGSPLGLARWIRAEHGL
jgi:hypothetical protein